MISRCDAGADLSIGGHHHRGTQPVKRNKTTYLCVKALCEEPFVFTTVDLLKPRPGWRAYRAGAVMGLAHRRARPAATTGRSAARTLTPYLIMYRNGNDVISEYYTVYSTRDSKSLSAHAAGVESLIPERSRNKPQR